MTGRAGGSRLSAALWTGFVVVVAAAGVALLPACGMQPLAAALPTTSWDFCPAAPLALSAETERGAVLRRLARQLELELATKELACASIPPPLPPPFELPTQVGPARPQQTAALRQPSEIDKRLAREHARTGELQISLIWDGPADLDLRVFCPSGEEIWFAREHRKHCGGTLDVDMNFIERHSQTPVENVFWPQGQAPRGKFRVVVSMFGRCGDARPAIPFQVRVKDGGTERTFSRTITDSSSRVAVTEFTR
jgi:hypothetical protein